MSTNRIGLTRADYKGATSTLCMGCGHDSVTNHIITALFQSDTSPYSVVKLSGIGCSSKTPAYFMNQSHGFNSIHGRMAAVATGVHLANRSLKIIGVSGDGDTASIGIGGFIHMVRRNVPMVYLIENNGVYGLTKGQFSATADDGAVSKGGEVNSLMSIDLCSLAIELGCGFVARSFSGDAKQLVPLLLAALRYNGTAIIDIISPCVAYANHEGSTKSYDYIKEHQVRLQELDFIAPKSETTADYGDGESTELTLADGSKLVLRKNAQRPFDLRNRDLALRNLREAREKKEILTGLFVHDESTFTLASAWGISQTPLVEQPESASRLTAMQLNQALKAFR